LINVFFGTYTEAYCKANDLFVAYKKDGSTIKAKTRMIENFQQELVKIDAGYIIGGWQEYIVDDETGNAKRLLLDILKDNNWEAEQLKIILQGLILGTTAFRVGKDMSGEVRISHIPIASALISRFGDGWVVETNVEDNGHMAMLREISTSQFYRRERNGVPEFQADISSYGIPFISVIPNRPTIDPNFSSWQGEPEWRTIQPQLDEINSSYSRLSMIEDRYANPLLVIKGINDTSDLEIKKDSNVLYLPEGSDVSFLEYQGNILSPCLEKIRELKQSVKNKCPELILQDLTAVNSGYALKIRLQSLKRKISTLRTTYFSVFENYFNVLLKMATGNDYAISIKAEDVIPEDTESLLKEYIALRGLGILSDRTIAESLGYDYDEEQEEIAKEVLDQNKTQEEEETEEVGVEE